MIKALRRKVLKYSPNWLLVLVSNILVTITRSRRIAPAEDVEHGLDIPIDMVYTWVDSNDPKWIAKKSFYASIGVISRKKVTESDNDARFRQFDELKYSLKSVFRYANWVRNIYIVTDGQVPEWFVAFDSRIKFVKHEDIFKEQTDLPVFNSHAIESNLHRIDGLSENFIYMNDDFFFRSPVSPFDFFTENFSKTKFFLSSCAFIPEVIDDNSFPVDIAAKNNATLLEKRYGYVTTNKFQHTPMALKKSVLELFEKENPDVFEVTSSARFRSWTDYSIVSSLIHFYGHHIGTAEPAKIPYFYVSFDDKLFELKMNILLLKKFKCFCINDVELDNNSEDVFEIFEKKMKILYPEPSKYEKDTTN
ncbi:Stealth CR1 domain-containing protein [Vibrio sp. SCSIO 43135]|uniref:stealth conserved region 3 domain-containing protein n=1 Tax=Vibrio sp. SCSIO 43135 TaxID=2819096 RepID=UPI0020765794|nr:stealth conserved region 3 domain-containing protein [Vibrio sp. SCSIO 43135]USD41336.1 Stealth CR1 domain-containing protein [Vibrio sp. SCSIO 43135]